jgi:hypothetical protein
MRRPLRRSNDCRPQNPGNRVTLRRGRAHFADEIGDEPLRLLFVCCHEAVPAESRVVRGHASHQHQLSWTGDWNGRETSLDALCLLL